MAAIEHETKLRSTNTTQVRLMQSSSSLLSRSAFREDQLILVLGLARSGTTWIGKILDSHPDVLYRHEPDTVLREPRLPALERPDDRASYAELSRDYVLRLAAANSLKSRGTRPFFRKSYRGEVGRLCSAGVTLALNVVAKATGTAEASKHWPVPDFISSTRLGSVRVAIKSVSSLGRAGFFARALPQAKFLIIVRHPCGQTSSIRRGTHLGVFGDSSDVDERLLSVRHAQNSGLTLSLFRTLPALDRYAWQWTLLYEKVLAEVSGLSNVKIVIYDELCKNPINGARSIFDFLQISWSPQTEAFIESSANRDAASGYYQIFRDANSASNRWRTELSAEEQSRVMNIARLAEVGRHWQE